MNCRIAQIRFLNINILNYDSNQFRMALSWKTGQKILMTSAMHGAVLYVCFKTQTGMYFDIVFMFLLLCSCMCVFVCKHVSMHICMY